MCAVELKRGGLHLSGTPLWLDARRKAELSFVSHAHSDHIARHHRVIATAPTLRLMTHRLGTLKSALPVPYNRPFELGPLVLELLPAGHILGSAQLRVTREDGQRIVYTGDLNLEPSLTAEPAQVAECDVLVIESTFGHPRYVFPPKEQVLDQVEAWALGNRDRGVASVLLGYALGKSQEIIKHLVRRGFRVCAHKDICAMANLYAELGTPVGELRCFDGTVEDGEVVVVPPHRARASVGGLWPRSVAVVTGWGVEPGAAARYGAQRAFTLSDPADFPSLVRYAKATGAEHVITCHGFTDELAAALREEGVCARAVHRTLQLELFPSAAGRAA
ncbi:MAG TPA: MBL fold metallo-hydrolase [Myxococcaceae bacterium]|nr:MBL fold metallo-hydrolase [Myxococcaceae bacterium]